jgi:hypothetical protein
VPSLERVHSHHEDQRGHSIDRQANAAHKYDYWL